MISVRVLNVKRWEKTGQAQRIPDDVWALLDSCRKTHDEVVAYAVEQAIGASEKVGGALPVVTLPYFRTQEHYDAYGRDKGPFGCANANARDVAAELRRLGFDVRFVYPEAPDEPLRSTMDLTR